MQHVLCDYSDCTDNKPFRFRRRACGSSPQVPRTLCRHTLIIVRKGGCVCEEIANRSGYAAWAIHVGCPLLLGGLEYVLWRPQRLLMFDWFAAVGLGALISAAREGAEPIASFLPDWTLFSLPNALWTYAVTAAMCLLWQTVGHSVVKAFFVIIAPATLSIGAEVGQAFELVPGRFDSVDLSLAIAAIAAAMWFTHQEESDDDQAGVRVLVGAGGLRATGNG